MKQLKKLYVGGDQIDAGAVEAFRQAAPHCLISWWKKSEVPETSESTEKEENRPDCLSAASETRRRLPDGSSPVPFGRVAYLELAP